MRNIQDRHRKPSGFTSIAGASEPDINPGIQTYPKYPGFKSPENFKTPLKITLSGSI